VNGVINVIMRTAQDTQGNLAMAGGGNRDNGAALRHGGDLEGGGNYRIYGRYFESPHTNRADGSTSVGGAGARGQVGFRTDFSRGPTTSRSRGTHTRRRPTR
jgi:iron complex outermembrane receptor protein